jgi:hypothetical protein
VQQTSDLAAIVRNKGVRYLLLILRGSDVTLTKQRLWPGTFGEPLPVCSAVLSGHPARAVEKPSTRICPHGRPSERRNTRQHRPGIRATKRRREVSDVP